MLTEVTSNTNKTFKHIKSLGNKNYRERHKEFVIEGFRLVKDALASGKLVQTIAVSDSFLDNEDNQEWLNTFLYNESINCYKFSDRLFKEFAHTETPQGILGILPMRSYSLNDILTNEASIVIFCDAVQDPGNIGTIIRTADAVGADAVILSKGCADLYNPKTVRSTMGALFHLPVIKIDNSIQALLTFKDKGLSVITGYLDINTKYPFQVNMKKGVVIVIGNEANGVSHQVVEISDELVKIPILGQAESLNVSIASGMLMYEVIRQRMY